MTSAQGQRLFISRQDLRRTEVQADPDAPSQRSLLAGQARLLVDKFALTANNITYAAFGESMKYWDFFPAAEAGWGCLPVWGFATVTESQAEGFELGQRVYGYLPAGSHLVVEPGKLSARGFTDLSRHRQHLALIYNQYSFCAADPGWSPDNEGLQAVLKPLFMTAFLIDDMLAEHHFFGARQLVISSASSKTAYATAFFLAQRRGPDQPRRVGLTSAANLEFTQGLGCYDEILLYEQMTALEPESSTVYIDFAGSAPLRRQIHSHFGDRLKYSSSIGGTHWDSIGSGRDLPGPKPTLFFAPAQAAKRSEPPPAGWGRSGLQERLGMGWGAFLERAQRADASWIKVVERQGAQALQSAYLSLLEGRADARQGLMLSLAAAVAD